MRNYFKLPLLALALAMPSTGFAKSFPKEKDLTAYLMVFHRDDTHGLYMAMSRDGYHFTALNDAHPVIAGDTIATQKGIRDPHIYRGPDGAFYLAMTDLHIFAQREGKRATEWERDGKTYGWGNNKGLVLMKSWDLIHWTHKIVNITDLSPKFAEIGCAWAPETIYDPIAKKLMIYLTMRYKNERNRLYYMYVNDDFDKIETEPQLLFEYPIENKTAIDGDICYAQGKYHLFYVAHDGTPGIKQAPETIYDPIAKKLMIYLTMRYKNERNRLYYMYVNDDFDKIETEPQLLFEYPIENKTAIDGDICYAQGKYHLFYVAHDGTPGIKQATSDKINAGWQYNPAWIDEEPTACEAPTVWKRIGEDKWVLMYDNYGRKVHNFGFEETSDFEHFKQLGRFNEGGVMFSTNFTQPKHGAVVHLTKKEAKKLAKQWGLDYNKLAK